MWMHDGTEALTDRQTDKLTHGQRDRQTDIWTYKGG